MAVDFANDTTKRAGALYTEWPENIILSPEFNGRHTLTEVEALAADIEKNGQDQPVGVRKNDDGLPVLIYGHRRYRAVCLLNERNPTAKRRITFKYYNVDTDSEAFEITVRENRNRAEVDPIDDAVNIRLFETKFGYTHEDIAKIYFPEAVTPAKQAEALRWVSQRAALQELAPEAATAVREGRVKITAAVALAKLTKTQQREKVAGTGKVKVSDVKPPTPISKPPVAANTSALVLYAAEAMATALDRWIEDATAQAENDLVSAHTAYRKLIRAPRQEQAA